MKHFTLLIFLLFASLAAFGQTKPRKAAPPSHRLQVLSRLNLSEVQFKISCARTANHAENQQCTSQVLRELQDAYKKLSLVEIPVPERYQATEIVFVFTEDILVDDDTVSLTVYETKNNDELYSDSRSRLVLGNDLTKLLAGYVETLGKE
jgi:hypothetical protein